MPSPRGKAGGAPTKTQAFAKTNLAMADNARESAHNKGGITSANTEIRDRKIKYQEAKNTPWADRTPEQHGLLENYVAEKQAIEQLEDEVAAREEKDRQLEKDAARLNAARAAQLRGMSPRERERAKKDEEQIKRDQDRQAEIDKELEDASARRQARNQARPGYRAAQKAKARRAKNKAAKRLRKAKKLLAAANNKNRSKNSRKKALAKAKKALQEAKAALAEKKRKEGHPPSDVEANENKALQEEIDALESDIEEAEKDLADPPEEEEPEVDPCSLPCECSVPCEPPDWCVCWRVPADGGDGGSGKSGDEPGLPGGTSEKGKGSDVDPEEEAGGGDGGKGGGAQGPPGVGSDGDATPQGSRTLSLSDDRVDIGWQDGQSGDDGSSGILFQQAEDEPGQQPEGVKGGAKKGPENAPEPESNEDEIKKPKDFQAAIVAAAKEFAEAKHLFSTDLDSGGKGVAHTPAKPVIKTEHWTYRKTVTGKGTKDEKAYAGIYAADAAKGIREIFENGKRANRSRQDRFGFDCASAVWVVLYKGILDVVGDKDFNKIFEGGIFVWGSHSTGAGVERTANLVNKIRKRAGLKQVKSAPTVIKKVGGWPDSDGGTQRGDILILQGEGQENLIVVTPKSGDYWPKGHTEVFGHGSGVAGEGGDTRVMPAGIHPAKDFIDYYGGGISGNHHRVDVEKIAEIVGERVK